MGVKSGRLPPKAGDLKDNKRLRFRVIHLIEFKQSNNFHIYYIF